MPIYYSLAERIPGQPAAARKLYAVARPRGETSVRDMANLISRTSTLSTADVMGMLEGLFQLVPLQLAAWQIVRFGDFGSFSVSLQDEGAATEEDFKAGLIHHVKVLFRPGKLFTQVMQAAAPRRISTPLLASQERSARRQAR